MSIAVATTKLIVEHLQDIVPEAECRRSYMPMLDPAELDEIGRTVLVAVPFGRDAENYTQGGMQKHELEIDLCINAKLRHRNDEPEAFNAEVDALIAFSEEIYALFLKKNVKNAGGLKVTFDQPEHVLLIDLDVLHNLNCFFSVVRVYAEVFAQPEV